MQYFIARSSNGRTEAFEAFNHSSNLCRASDSVLLENDRLGLSYKLIYYFMPFNEEIKETITKYISADLPSEKWYVDNNFYGFISDSVLKDRLILEFENARMIYKFFEGIQATEEKLLAQIKTQVLMYASIQEAAISYVLFTLYKDTSVVKNLLSVPKYVRIDIPEEKKKLLVVALSHDDKMVVPTYLGKGKTSKMKVRFDEKVKVCYKLGIISEKMKGSLINIYSLRNTVHIEAELRKLPDFSLPTGEHVYRTTIGLSIELNKSIVDGLLFN